MKQIIRTMKIDGSVASMTRMVFLKMLIIKLFTTRNKFETERVKSRVTESMLKGGENREKEKFIANIETENTATIAISKINTSQS